MMKRRLFASSSCCNSKSIADSVIIGNNGNAKKNVDSDKSSSRHRNFNNRKNKKQSKKQQEESKKKKDNIIANGSPVKEIQFSTSHTTQSNSVNSNINDDDFLLYYFDARDGREEDELSYLNEKVKGGGQLLHFFDAVDDCSIIEQEGVAENSMLIADASDISTVVGCSNSEEDFVSLLTAPENNINDAANIPTVDGYESVLNNNNHCEENDYELLAEEHRPNGCLHLPRPHIPGIRRFGLKQQWGFPGSLTSEQLKSYQQFRSELEQLKGISNTKHEGKIIKNGQTDTDTDEGYLYDIVHSYQGVEQEAYAICRFLRHGNFNVSRTMKNLSTLKDSWYEAKKHNFYKNISDIIGNDITPYSVLLTQFPFIYMGSAKEGYPICYFNAGTLNIDGINCVMNDIHSLPNIVYHNMMYGVKDIYIEAQKQNPHFQQLQQITIMNLEGLSGSQLNSKTYEIVKAMDFVSLAFAEMLHKIIIVNAPSFFSMAWTVIKRFLDPVTANKIEIYSSPKKGCDRLLELVDKEVLASDYGGQGGSFSDAIIGQGRNDSNSNAAIPCRQIVELMSIHKKRYHASCEFELKANEKASFSIYSSTQCTSEFLLNNNNENTNASEGNNAPVRKIEVTKSATNGGKPFCMHLGDVYGPGTYTLDGTLKDSISNASEHFLVIGEVFDSEGNAADQ